MGLALLASACGDDDDEGSGTGTEATSETGGTTGEGTDGGEFIDGAQLVAGPPSHLDPALNSELDPGQVIQLLYDGLTEFADVEDGEPELRGLAAESWESNDDATEFVFHIKEGLQFSDGTPVLPSSFKRGWDRAADPELAADYAYLFSSIEGTDDGGNAEGGISGVVADDEAMTLTVTLKQPYADFPAVVSHLIFSPMPEAVEELEDQSQWERGIMIGNGPYKMEAPQNDQEIVLIRNDLWAGDVYGNTRATLDRIVFRIFADVDSAYAAFEAGETHNATIPPGRYTEATTTYGYVPAAQLSSYHFVIGMREEDPLGGPDKVKLRQAISLAIDRQAINDAVYDGSRQLPTGLTMPGIPGYEEDLCEYCVTDPDRARELLEEYQDEGGEIPNNIRIRFNAGAGHEDVVAIIQQNLEEVLGIRTQQEPINTEVYFNTVREEGCPGICRAGWFWDYPIYDNGIYDLLHSASIGGNNLGYYSNPEFDELINEGRTISDDEERWEKYREAERIALNEDTAIIPINWYNSDQVFADGVEGFRQEALGWVRFETIRVSD